MRQHRSSQNSNRTSKAWRREQLAFGMADGSESRFASTAVLERNRRPGVGAFFAPSVCAELRCAQSA